MSRFSRKSPATGIEDWEQLAPQLARLPHVKTAAPALYDSRLSLADPSTATASRSRASRVRHGRAAAGRAAASEDRFDRRAARRRGDLPGIILGSRLAETIGAVIGKQVTLTHPERPHDAVRPAPQLRASCASPESSNPASTIRHFHWASCRLPAAQKVFDLADVVNSIELHARRYLPGSGSRHRSREADRAEARRDHLGGAEPPDC